MTPSEVWIAAPWAVMADPNISMRAKVCYVLLLQHARPFEGKMVVWPSQARLAQAMGMSVDTVKRAMTELDMLNLIKRVRRMNNTSLTYLLPLKNATLTAPVEWLARSNEPSVHPRPDGECAEQPTVSAPAPRGSKTSEVKQMKGARKPRVERGSRNETKPRHPISFEDESYYEDHKRAKPKKAEHNSKEFRKQAETFRCRYNAMARITGWAPCEAMTPGRRKQLHDRIADDSLANLDLVFRGLRQKAQEGLIRDVDYLLRRQEAGLGLVEAAKRKDAHGELAGLAPLVHVPDGESS